MSLLFCRFSSKFSTLMWKQVTTRFKSEYSKILQLIDMILTIPATSTACERGFSQMKLIKSDTRTKLSEQAMSNNLVIKLHSAPIADFDPLPATEYWLLLKEQHPGSSGTSEYKQYGQYCRGITRIHRLPSRPSHPYGRQPHSLILMSTLYKASSRLLASS